MDYQAIMQKAVGFMSGRKWKQMTAKSKAFEQSLFDHTLVELDALITLLPLLRSTFSPPLTDQEEQVLLGGIIAHDVGKELEEWQEYVKGQRGFVSDVNRQLAEEVVPRLAELLGFEGIEEMLSGVLLHMRHERTPAKTMERVLFGGHTNERWKTLADLIDAVDNLCSAKGLFAGLQCLEERSCFSNHIRSAYHLIQLRGVSTTLLHLAAIDAFIDKGWSPLLHYSNGTIYVVSAAEEASEPLVDEIEARFAEQIKNAIGSEFTQQVVGNPIFTILPKPELFDCTEVSQYLRASLTRVTNKTFARKKEVDQFKPAGSYLKSLGFDNPTEDQLKRQADRIARAYPEMSAFAFFKAMLQQGFLGDPNSDLLEKTFEKIFGKGSFVKFKQSSAQLSAAKHLEQVIDPFWQSDGKVFNIDLEKVEYAPDATRQQLLIDSLTSIAKTVYGAMPTENCPQRATPEAIAKCFMIDLVHPGRQLNLSELVKTQPDSQPGLFDAPQESQSDLAALVSEQMRAYSRTKENARRAKGKHLCPICNAIFEGGTEAKADFVDNPDAHTNRAVSHSGGGKIVICDACKFERFLQQLLLGSKVSEVLVLFPRMNIGHSSGEMLRQKVLSIWDSALTLMSEANPDPDQHLSLGLTYNLARKLADVNVFRLSATEIVELMTYRSGDDTAKKHRRELEDNLKILYGVDDLIVEVINDNWGTDYTTREEALQALIEDTVSDDDARKVRAQSFRLTPQLRVICQTPHMILVPLTNPISVKDDSDTNAGIRKLYITLILGLALDCSVAVIKAGEVITFEGGEGVARVPPVPALRDLIGSEWVSIVDATKWLNAIGAAALLASATAFPERSNLYAILRSMTPGHIIRRIEQQEEKGKQLFSLQQRLQQLNLLKILEEVLR